MSKCVWSDGCLVLWNHRLSRFTHPPRTISSTFHSVYLSLAHLRFLSLCLMSGKGSESSNSVKKRHHFEQKDGTNCLGTQAILKSVSFNPKAEGNCSCLSDRVQPPRMCTAHGRSIRAMEGVTRFTFLAMPHSILNLDISNLISLKSCQRTTFTRSLCL